MPDQKHAGSLKIKGREYKLDFFFSAYVCTCQSLSRVWLCVTPWTVARQALLSMGFSRQEYWSGLSFPSPGDLPDPGMEAGSAYV